MEHATTAAAKKPTAKAPAKASAAAHKGSGVTRRRGAALDLSSILLPYQLRWVEDPARFQAGCFSRQSGKSFSTACKVAIDLSTRPNTMWMIAAPSERQSRESLDKVRDWLRALGVALDERVTEREAAMELRLGNGSRVLAVPGKPDTVRGMSANVWLDEFAFFEDPDATWKAILPSIINPLRGGEKRVILTSTYNGKSGRGKRFYDIINEPQRGKMRWSTVINPLKKCIAEGLPVDYEEIAAGIGDPIAVAQELDCVAADDSNTLLPYDIIALAESFEATESAEPELWRGGRDIRLGIDFGRTNDPTVCWALERVGDVLYTREVLVLRDMSTPDQEDILRSRIRAASRVCFDYTGPGIGMGDHLAKEFGAYAPAKHSFGKLELCTFTSGFKRDIFPKLRRAFEAPSRLRIPISNDIRDDLHAMQQLVKNGEYTYAAPHTAEGHSDRCTALALALRAAEGAGDAAHLGVIGDRRTLRRRMADKIHAAWTRSDRERTLKKIFG